MQSGTCDVADSIDYESIEKKSCEIHWWQERGEKEKMQCVYIVYKLLFKFKSSENVLERQMFSRRNENENT